MRLLASTDLALRVLMRLAIAPEKHVSTSVLACQLVISRHHLQKIVQFLTEARFVRTVRGARGGVMLAVPADKIRVGDVVRRHERNLAIAECFRADGETCTLAPECHLRGMLVGAQEAFYEYLNQNTVADCLFNGASLVHRNPRQKSASQAGVWDHARKPKAERARHGSAGIARMEVT